MSKWSIRNHLLLLSLLPVLLASICLTIYFTFSQLNQITTSLRQSADVSMDHLSVSSEYALFSGNTAELQRVSDRIMQNRSVISIIVYDTDGKPMLQSRNQHDHRRDATIRLYEDRLITLERDIIANETPLDDFDVNDAASTQPQLLGSVEMVLSNHLNNQRKTRTLIRSLLISLGILCISGLIGLMVSRRIANPVLKLTEIVRHISAGRLDMRADVAAPAELGILEHHINKMADDLQEAQTAVEERIDRVAEELEETMEELEIRNAQLDIARSRAQQDSAAKSEFLASMSHEIRTPLSGIIGFSELLEQSGLPPREQEYASTIRSSSRLLLGIIEEVLDISKIESGKIRIVNDDCDINEIFDRVFSLLYRAAVDKKIEFFYTIDDDVPNPIITDAMRVQQILMNLASNAIKFTSQGHVHIHVSREDSTIRFAVHDTGIGLDENASSKLFDAFTQADETISREYGGTGLGLMISKKLTRLMQGDIGFDSAVGEGSTFWFSLPLIDSTLSAPDDAHTLEGMHIAVIGDHDGTRDALCARLDILNASTRWYRAGDRSALLDESETSDVIIISISHGEQKQTYTDLVWHIHQNLSGTPIVVLTSAIDDVLDASMQTAGAVLVTPRYLGNHKLLQSLYELLGKESPISADESSSSMRVSGHGISSLIVDDNTTNLKLASIILGKSGITTTTASSGMEALALCREHEFDIIFLDILMPQMDGYETVRRLRRETINGSSRIIALTAHMMPEERKRAIESGFDSIIIKPLSEAIVNQVLDGSTEEPMTDRGRRIRHRDMTFDPDEALQLAAGNGELARKMTSMFIEQLPDHREELLAAREDTVRLKRSIHTLHGATQYVGVPRLRRAVSGFEMRMDDASDQVRHAELAAVIAEIDSLMREDTDAMLTGLDN